MVMPRGPNQRCSFDLFADQSVDGQRIRVVVVVDEFTREFLALVVGTSLSGWRGARKLVAHRLLRPAAHGRQ